MEYQDLGAIIEAKYDEDNELMKWPISISPYHCAILPFINKNDKKNLDKANNAKNVKIIILIQSLTTQL